MSGEARSPKTLHVVDSLQAFCLPEHPIVGDMLDWDLGRGEVYEVIRSNNRHFPNKGMVRVRMNPADVGPFESRSFDRAYVIREQEEEVAGEIFRFPDVSGS